MSDIIQVINNTTCFNSPPNINTTTIQTFIGGKVTIDLTLLILDQDGNLDPSSLEVVGNATQKGGNTTVNGFILEISDIVVYNGISPNNDGVNDNFIIQYIDLLPDTQQNKVYIYNRWGSKVFEVSNYNNTTNIFRGLNNNGNELTSGTYFYKIEFANGRKNEHGYLTLKKP